MQVRSLGGRADITHLLDAASTGDAKAAECLLPLIYEELRALAHARLAGERGVVTLPATALVHEAWLRLAQDPQANWENRSHFFAAAAEAMRRVAVEYARSARRQKRGGDLQRVTLDTLPGGIGVATPDLLDLHDALERLESIDANMAQVVKLRYFAGMTVEETASVMQSSARSVNRNWTAARAWLNREMQS